MPNRKIANINPFPFNLAMPYPIEINTVSKDINMNLPRDRSNSSSYNLSRDLLTHPNFSSILYIDRIEAQNDNSL